MLAEGHSQRERVRRLLEAASSAMGSRECLDGDIELDVTIAAPRGLPLPDATNMLGGLVMCSNEGQPVPSSITSGHSPTSPASMMTLRYNSFSTAASTARN